jgi:RecA-family ATPase
MVTIDVLERFRARSRGGKDNAYAADYDAIKALQALASELHSAILIIHHLRKGADDGDPIDKISGTLGLSGGADAVVILESNSTGQTIYGRGRDLEEGRPSRTCGAGRSPCSVDCKIR